MTLFQNFCLLISLIPNLVRFGCITTRCHLRHETLLHTLRDCWKAREVWSTFHVFLCYFKFLRSFMVLSLLISICSLTMLGIAHLYKHYAMHGNIRENFMAKLGVNSSSSCVLCSSPSHGLSNLLMDDFSGVGSGMQALVAALSSFVPKKNVSLYYSNL